ncbi:MAG: Deoxyuridine 5'-triphosphate nucleotidohydrolase [Phycisphaerae bacterium]|nr:Deoxyuridine 5'-triphosphate nucleotidohydrolase [Phycisphaerae bacterium]
MSGCPIRVEVRRKPGCEDVPLPARASAHAAGLDISAAVEQPLTLAPGAIALVPAGFFMALPAGYEAQVRPRSGLALRHGITCVNSPGTIDADYRGEVAVILGNLGPEPFTITRGMRIAQMVVKPVLEVELAVVDRLPDTERGAGGFGHTGA